MIFLVVMAVLITGVSAVGCFYQLMSPAASDPDNQPQSQSPIDPLVKELSDRKRAILKAEAEAEVRLKEESILNDIEVIKNWLTQYPNYNGTTNHEEAATELKQMGFKVVYKGKNYRGKVWEITVP